MVIKAHLISGRHFSEPLPLLSDAVLDAVLAETAYRGRKAPTHEALRDALLSILLNYRQYQALDAAPSLSAARQSLREAHKACRDLLLSLRSIQDSGTLFALIGRQIGREHPSGQPSVYDVLRKSLASARDLDRWIGRAAAATRTDHPHFTDGVWKEAPAGLSENWLLARALPRVFTDLFGAPFSPAVTRDESGGASPGTRFVIASCRALGLGEKTPAAVKKAWNRRPAARAGHGRLKSGRVSPP